LNNIDNLTLGCYEMTQNDTQVTNLEARILTVFS